MVRSLREKMRKQYKPVIWYKDKTPEEFADYIDTHHKIGFNRIQQISDNAHEKYPLISKTELNLIVKEMWIILRRYLVQGYIFELGEFFTHLKIVWRLQNAREFLKIAGSLAIRHKFKKLWSEEKINNMKVLGTRYMWKTKWKKKEE